MIRVCLFVCVLDASVSINMRMHDGGAGHQSLRNVGTS